jgi:hypothetical protein
MSDYKAINQTYQGFLAVEFCISPRKRVFYYVSCALLPQIIENALFPQVKNSDLSVSSHVYRNNSENLFAGGAGVAEKTSLELPAADCEKTLHG